jgi:hypothetical protein
MSVFLGRWIFSFLTLMLTRIWPNGYFRTAEKSARDTERALYDTDEFGEHPKALYVNGHLRAEPSPEAKDVAKGKMLWEDSVRYANLKHGDTALLNWQ